MTELEALTEAYAVYWWYTETYENIPTAEKVRNKLKAMMQERIGSNSHPQRQGYKTHRYDD
jgi:hypothetical protein